MLCSVHRIDDSYRILRLTVLFRDADVWLRHSAVRWSYGSSQIVQRVQVDVCLDLLTIDTQPTLGTAVHPIQFYHHAPGQLIDR